MSLLVRFANEDRPTTTDQYDEVVRRLEEGGDFPPDGMEYHVCFLRNGNVAVSEIWDSREQFEAFGQRLMPMLSEAGIDPGEPEVLEIHNTIRR